MSNIGKRTRLPSENMSDTISTTTTMTTLSLDSQRSGDGATSGQGNEAIGPGENSDSERGRGGDGLDAEGGDFSAGEETKPLETDANKEGENIGQASGSLGQLGKIGQVSGKLGQVDAKLCQSDSKLMQLADAKRKYGTDETGALAMDDQKLGKVDETVGQGSEKAAEGNGKEVSLSSTNPSRRASAKAAFEDDYFIAADLTLYSNPLNNALHISSKPYPDRAHGEKKKVSHSHKAGEDDEEIAADMTKYDSPMADLDKRRNIRADEVAEGKE